MNIASVLALVVALNAAAESRPPVPDAATPPDLTPQVTEGIVHATPTELWKVWSTPEGYKQLGAAKCDVDFRIGGLIRTAYDPAAKLGDAATIQSQILAYEPERMIAFQIQKPPVGLPFPNAWKSTWTVATMTDLGDGTTRVRVSEMGYDASAESQRVRAFFTSGNAQVLKFLQSRYAADAGAATPGLGAIH